MSTKKPLRYWLDLGSHSYPAREVRGEEKISAPFRFELKFVLPAGSDFDPDEILREEATIRLERDETERRISGVVTDASIRAVQRGAPEVTIVVEPRFALTRFRRDIRLFRDKSAIDVVIQVLAGHGIAPELRLADTYAIRPYNVQMRESDFDYVNRLLEDEGVFLFFLEDGTLVLGDRASSYDTISGIPLLHFAAGSGLDGKHDCVTDVGARAAFLPGKLTLRDFNAEHPSLDMDVTTAGPTEGGPEYYDFPGEYEVPAEGSAKVKKMAESLACESLVHTGKSFSARLLPGATFELALAPPGVEDGKYVITRVVHRFDVRDDGFSVQYEALPADVTFRPMRVTDAPVLTDPLTGFITGPPGEDIYTDAYGRVKVHFHWDRQFPFDDSCSHWIPVLQDNTGHSGSIPRIGWEVMVHFLEGDPDRPVVVGRVFNPNDPPHLFLPVNKTRSTIKSLSSPREDKRDDSGTNEIMTEDLQGLEFLQLHAQKDQNVVVGNDKTETVLMNQASTVERDEKVSIGMNHTATVNASIHAEVKRDQAYFVGGNRKLTVDEAESTTVGANHSLSIGAMHIRRIGTDDTTMAQQKLTEMVGGVILEASMKDNTNYGTRISTLAVGGAHVELAKQDKNEAVGKARAETIGGLFMVKADGEITLRADKKRATTIGGPLRVKAAKAMTLVGSDKFVSHSATAKLTAPEGIILKVGDTTVVLKDGAMSIDGKTEIKLTITGNNDQGASKATQV